MIAIPESPVLLGFAITQHCNLRCPHCIRDDVTTVQSLELDLMARVIDDAREMFGNVIVSLTGGEPLIHQEFAEMIELFKDRQVPYRFVSNGWHLKRIIPLLERYPAESVRLSLSGASEEIHDEERGRGSFKRVLLSVAMLTSRQIPASLSIVIDRRDRHQVREVADLAEALGCVRLHYILPQPVIGSLERNTDLDPEEWYEVVAEVNEIKAEPGRRTAIQIDYGAPMEEEFACDTFALKRIYIDARGRLSTCCQLSEYGFNDADVVADLHEVSLKEAWPVYVERVRAQQEASARPADGGDEFDALPCIRCARVCGKMEWVKDFPGSRWAASALPPGRDRSLFTTGATPLVQLSR